MVGGIPRFVESQLYAGNFGFEWTVHRRTQLDDTSSNTSEQAFAQKTGLTPEDVRGQLVLDAGCGMGRFADVSSRWGATVVGIDLSVAIESAQANLANRPGVHFAQASILEPPFAPATFDVIYSIGVLHHTPDTRQAFDRLVPLLKPGGRIAIWLYSAYNESAYRDSDRWRRLTTRLSNRALYRLCRVAVPAYHLYRLPFLGPFLCEHLPISMDPRPEWRVLDTFDWYSPRYQWKHTYEEVFPWFEEAGLTDVRVQGAPVAVSGRKLPASAANTPRRARSRPPARPGTEARRRR